MTTLALIATILIVLATIGVTTGAILFLLKSRETAQSTNPDTPLPKAAILLALRGSDPYLEDCVRSLLRQDYPDYALHIVVDSESDPAWDIVNRVVKEARVENAHIALLRDPLFTCSLKCSALLQMLREIEPDVEVLALIDGDVVPHSSWLRQLAAPLNDPRVGATYGIPWYFPKGSNWASVARKVCWIPAAVLMALAGWMWGGSAALTSRVFRDPALVERWSRSVSSDASMSDVIKAHNLRLEWARALVMPNLESAGFATLVNQLGRSLATSRLYLNGWPLTLMAVGLAVGALLLPVLVCVISVLLWNVTASIVSASALGAYLLILIVFMMLVERRALQIVKRNGATVPPVNIGKLAKIVLVVPLAHGIYLASAFKAHFTRTLTWRGVRYAIRSKLDVERIESALTVIPAVSDEQVLITKQASTSVDPVPATPFSSRFTDFRHGLPKGQDRRAAPSTRRGRHSSELVRE